MARTVLDAARLLEAMAGGDFTSGLETSDLRGKRIGVIRNYYGAGHPGVERIYDATVEVLRKAGAEIVDESLRHGPSETRLDECHAGLHAQPRKQPGRLLERHIQADGPKMIVEHRVCQRLGIHQHPVAVEYHQRQGAAIPQDASGWASGAARRKASRARQASLIRIRVG